MDIKALTPHLSITPQVLVAELEAVSQMGFKAIICNRPDGEGPDQPSFKEMEQAALNFSLRGAWTKRFMSSKPNMPTNMANTNTSALG